MSKTDVAFRIDWECGELSSGWKLVDTYEKALKEIQDFEIPGVRVTITKVTEKVISVYTNLE